MQSSALGLAFVLASAAGCGPARPRPTESAPITATGASATARPDRSPAVVAAITRRAFEACRGPGPDRTRFASVREVDWCNQGFAPVMFPLREGRGEQHEYEELGGPHDTYLARLEGVAYGDLDGDGHEEAALLVDEQTFYTSGATAKRQQVYVLGVRAERVELLASGSSALPTPALVIDGGALTLVYVAHGELCATRLAVRGRELVAAAEVCAPGQ